MSAGKLIFVYQTICEVNNKSYIGIHKTNNINDGYIGCGIYSDGTANKNTAFHKAVRKYGHKYFRRYILSFYETYEEALEEERYIVNTQWVLSRDNYNCAIGGKGNSTLSLSKEQLQERSRKLSEKRKGVPLSESHKKSISKNNAKYWVGKKRSDSFKDKLRQARLGMRPTEEVRKRLSAIRLGKPSNNRKTIIQFTKNNEFVAEHQSVTGAAKIIGCVKGAIHNNLSGLSCLCSGFIFKYKNI